MPNSIQINNINHISYLLTEGNHMAKYAAATAQDLVAALERLAWALRDHDLHVCNYGANNPEAERRADEVRAAHEQVRRYQQTAAAALNNALPYPFNPVLV